MTAGLKVAVAGGGVAGAATAIALARAGAEVTVYEAYPDPGGQVGSFVSLAVNGLRALEVLGCLPRVQAAGFEVERHRMWSARGKLLGDVARGRPAGDPRRSVTVMRADLVSVLRDEAVRQGAAVVTGQRVPPDFPARARAAGADLIVGADGIWSGTRTVLDPGAPRPAYAGLCSVSGISGEVAGVSRHEGRPGDGPSSWNMIFGRNGAFLYLTAPDGSIWWSAQVSAPPPADLSAVTVAGLAAIYRGQDRAVAILDAARHVLAATAHHRLAPVRVRHSGDTVLVGDAAHPAGAGQGACMALEDAVVLAGQLQRSGTVASALAGFDAVRRGRAGKLATMASSSNDAKTAGPVAARVRDVVMPVMVPRFYEKATAWLYEFDAEPLPAQRACAG